MPATVRAILCAVVCAVLVCTLPGCIGETPKVEVTGARVLEQTETGLVVEVSLLASNNGDDPLPLRTVEYTVSLADGRKFSGTRSAEATLPPKGSHQLTLPAAIAMVPVKDGAAPPLVLLGGTTFRISGNMTYVQPGKIPELLYDTGLYRPSSGFGGSGIMGMEGVFNLIKDEAKP